MMQAPYGARIDSGLSADKGHVTFRRREFGDEAWLQPATHRDIEADLGIDAAKLRGLRMQHDQVLQLAAAR